MHELHIQFASLRLESSTNNTSRSLLGFREMLRSVSSSTSSYTAPLRSAPTAAITSEQSRIRFCRPLTVCTHPHPPLSEQRSPCLSAPQTPGGAELALAGTTAAVLRFFPHRHPRHPPRIAPPAEAAASRGPWQSRLSQRRNPSATLRLLARPPRRILSTSRAGSELPIDASAKRSRPPMAPFYRKSVLPGWTS